MRSYGMKPPEMDARTTRAYLGNIIQESKYLTADLAVSATSASVPYVPRGMAANLGWIVIDAFTTQCEVRKITSKTLESVSWSGGLAYGHSAGDVVIFTDNPNVNAAWFGALGNNSNDDTSAIQAAINAADDSVSGSGYSVTCYLPPGQYKISSALTIPDYVWLVGAPGSTQSRIRQTTANPVITIGHDTIHWGLQDLFIDGDNNATIGIELDYAREGFVYNCWVLECTKGLTADQSWSNSVNHSFFIDCGTSGIELTDQVQDFTVFDCHIEGSNTYGLHIPAPSNYVHGIRIKDSIFQDCGTFGIYVATNSGKVHGVQIDGCYFEGNNADNAGTAADIHIQEGLGIGIYGCLFTVPANAMTAAIILDDVDEAIVSGCGSTSSGSNPTSIKTSLSTGTVFVAGCYFNQSPNDVGDAIIRVTSTTLSMMPYSGVTVDSWIHFTSARAQVGYDGTTYAAALRGNNRAVQLQYASGTVGFEVDNSGNNIVGTAALATTATDGFLYIPTCNGAPTGTPTSKTGRVPIVYDTANNKLYIYNGGWVGVTLA